MKAGILFSGGKDSSLAALMLSRDYEVELNTFVFDERRTVPQLESVADALGFPFVKRVFESGFLDTVVEMMVSTGYPNDAINLVHRNAVRTLAESYDVIGDGTRLNDRVPMLSLPEVQSLEARHECSYVRPLLGFEKRKWNAWRAGISPYPMVRPERSTTETMNTKSGQHSAHEVSIRIQHSQTTTSSLWLPGGRIKQNW
jgi:predicted subunit of tRNA(5-methylaminomethyl-2-thiouridylate) methyltransferase